MTIVRMYPNYWHNYYYETGSCEIEFWRTRGAQTIYSDTLIFNTPAEAQAYFDEL